MNHDFPSSDFPAEYLPPSDTDSRPGRYSWRHAADLCKEFTLEAGFNFFLFSFRPPPLAAIPPAVTLTNYPRPWLDAYRQRSYCKIDPVAHKLKTAVSPFTWSSVDSEDPSVCDLFREARAHGLEGGACFPLFGPGAARAAFTLAGGTIPAAGKSRDAFFAQASFFGLRIFENVLKSVSGGKTDDESSVLTTRQQQILTSFAEGLSYREVAARHQIKQSTAKTLLGRCCAKLGVGTREEAIAKAVATGQIFPLGAPTALGFHPVAACGSTHHLPAQ